MWVSFQIVAVLCFMVGLLLFWPDVQELPVMYPSTIGLIPDWVFDDWQNVALLVTVTALLHTEYVRLRRQWSFRWLTAEQAAKYLRQRMHEDGLEAAGAFMDTIHEGTTTEKFEDTAIAWLVDGVNGGHIRMRGTLKNSVSPRIAPIPLKDHWSSAIQKRPQAEAQIGADGNVYENLLFARSGVKAYVKMLAKDQKMKLKEARQKGKLSKFIKEHEADPDGDLDKLDEVIKRPTQESAKATRKASSQDASGD